MSRPVGAGRDLTATAIDYDPGAALTAKRAADARKVAIILIGRGLELAPGNPWGMAHDVAQALGLIPTVPAQPRSVTLTDDRPARAKGATK